VLIIIYYDVAEGPPQRYGGDVQPLLISVAPNLEAPGGVAEAPGGVAAMSSFCLLKKTIS